MAKLSNHRLFAKTTKGGDKGVTKAAQKISISILLISLPVLYVSLLHVPPGNLFHDTTFWFLISNTIIIIVATDSGFLRPPSTDSNLLYDDYVKHSKVRSAGLPRPSPIPMETLIDVVDENENTNSSENEESATEENLNKSSMADEHPLTLNYVMQEVGEENENENEEEEEVEFVHGAECPGSHESYVQEPLALVIDRNERSDGHRLPQRSRSEMGKRARTVFENERPLRRSVTEKKDRGGAGEISDQYSKMSDEELNRRVEDFIRRFKQIRLEELRNV